MNDVLKIITQAKKLEDSAALLFNKGINDPKKYFISGWILAALSIELYLKAIALKENGGYKKVHNISVLFGELKPETKATLENFLKIEIEKYDLEFQHRKNLIENITQFTISNNVYDILNDLSTLFVDFRYIFQEQQPRSFYYIEPIRIVLENYTKDFKCFL